MDLDRFKGRETYRRSLAISFAKMARMGQKPRRGAGGERYSRREMIGGGLCKFLVETSMLDRIKLLI
jgi:hypothetical protein